MESCVYAKPEHGLMETVRPQDMVPRSLEHRLAERERQRLGCRPMKLITHHTNTAAPAKHYPIPHAHVYSAEKVLHHRSSDVGAHSRALPTSGCSTPDYPSPRRSSEERALRLRLPRHVSPECRSESHQRRTKDLSATGKTRLPPESPSSGSVDTTLTRTASSGQAAAFVGAGSARPPAASPVFSPAPVSPVSRTHAFGNRRSATADSLLSDHPLPSSKPQGIQRHPAQTTAKTAKLESVNHPTASFGDQPLRMASNAPTAQPAGAGSPPNLTEKELEAHWFFTSELGKSYVGRTEKDYDSLAAAQAYDTFRQALLDKPGARDLAAAYGADISGGPPPHHQRHDHRSDVRRNTDRHSKTSARELQQRMFNDQDSSLGMERVKLPCGIGLENVSPELEVAGRGLVSYFEDVYPEAPVTVALTSVNWPQFGIQTAVVKRWMRSEGEVRIHCPDACSAGVNNLLLRAMAEGSVKSIAEELSAQALARQDGYASCNGELYHCGSKCTLVSFLKSPEHSDADGIQLCDPRAAMRDLDFFEAVRRLLGEYSTPCHGRRVAPAHLPGLLRMSSSESRDSDIHSSKSGTRRTRPRSQSMGEDRVSSKVAAAALASLPPQPELPIANQTLNSFELNRSREVEDYVISDAPIREKSFRGKMLRRVDDERGTVLYFYLPSEYRLPPPGTDARGRHYNSAGRWSLQRGLRAAAFRVSQSLRRKPKECPQDLLERCNTFVDTLVDLLDRSSSFWCLRPRLPRISILVNLQNHCPVPLKPCILKEFCAIACSYFSKTVRISFILPPNWAKEQCSYFRANLVASANSSELLEGSGSTRINLSDKASSAFQPTTSGLAAVPLFVPSPSGRLDSDGPSTSAATAVQSTAASTRGSSPSSCSSHHMEDLGDDKLMTITFSEQDVSSSALTHSLPPRSMSRQSKPRSRCNSKSEKMAEEADKEPKSASTAAGSHQTSFTTVSTDVSHSGAPPNRLATLRRNRRSATGPISTAIRNLVVRHSNSSATSKSGNRAAAAATTQKNKTPAEDEDLPEVQPCPFLDDEVTRPMLELKNFFVLSCHSCPESYKCAHGKSLLCEEEMNFESVVGWKKRSSESASLFVESTSLENAALSSRYVSHKSSDDHCWTPLGSTSLGQHTPRRRTDRSRSAARRHFTTTGLYSSGGGESAVLDSEAAAAAQVMHDDSGAVACGGWNYVPGAAISSCMAEYLPPHS